MEFKKFNDKVKAQFDKMRATGKLFRSNISGNDLWTLYLSSFINEMVFRDPNSSEHNCNCCKNFIRRYGNIVAIDEEGNLESIFSNLGDCGEYTPSVKACAKVLEESQIKDVFFETYNTLNLELNYEKCNKNQDTYKLGIEAQFKQYTQEEANAYPRTVDINKIYEFNHFQLDLPKQFVKFTNSSIEHITAIYRDKYSVFKRAMEEISLDTLILVKDLINQGSLLDGTTHLHSIEEIIKLKQRFELNNTQSSLSNINSNKDNWYWFISYEIEERTAKFKNTLIGVLCTELAEGMELNKACLNWNKRVDPVNYNKAKAPITEAQRKLAEKFVVEEGYLESFNRRLATIDDIKASEILHKNSDNAKAKSVTIFDSIKTPSGTGRYKRSEFDKIEEVSIEKFMKDILPTTTNVELLMENKFEGNLVNLTTIVDKEAKQLFKWDNPFSYTFNGGLAGKSQIKEAVKTAGGKIDGVLRFSIMWAENDGDNSDLDAHCKEPRGNLIYFSDKRSPFSGGWLDIDITNPKNQMPKGAVENISFPTLEKMDNGDYKFLVHQYSHSNSKGFKAEIEFNGDIYSYEYNQPVSGKIEVATITKQSDALSITHHLPVNSATITKDLWGISTQEFYKVNLVCLTPNHWGDNNVGNKHYLFMLQGCKNPNSVRGFHNEHLTSDLLKHRKVLDVLGNSAMIEPTDTQLAGVGFNATVREEVILRLSGSHKRVIKVKF